MGWWDMPAGPWGRYRIRIEFCGPKRMQRVGAAGLAGLWVDFDERNVGRIYVSTAYHYGQQLDTLQHELHHAVTDFGGRLAWFADEYRKQLGEAQIARALEQEAAE